MSYKRIGLFGGSFNPVHKSHVDLGIAVKNVLGLDEVWILIDKEPRGKKVLTSYQDRLHMVKLATSKHDFFVVDKLAMQKEGRTHDHNTILELKKAYPQYRFTMITGLDTMLYFPEWAAPEIFCQNVDFAVAKRPPYGVAEIDTIKQKLGNISEIFRYHMIEFPESETSSTLIRNQLMNLKHSDSIHPEVRHYILNQGLYITN